MSLSVAGVALGPLRVPSGSLQGPFHPSCPEALSKLSLPRLQQ